ncbi:MAG: choice-of-anchor V domain-containing protein, partial [Bacteroidota bacterium]
VPVSGYVPGQTYTITATATAVGRDRFGFQISPQSVSGTYLGTLIVTDPTNTQIVSTKYIEHKSAGTIGTSGFHTWTFNWIAPVSGTGPVSFYGAFNCSDHNNSSSGDLIFTSTLTVSQCSASTTVTANGPTAFCSGGSVTLDAGSGFSSYLWSNSATTQTISVSASGTYSVTVTNNGGCQAVATSAAVVVNPTPPVPIITPNGSLTFCQGASITLSATSGLSSYHWSNNATTQAINVSTGGNYSLTITNSSGCSAVSLATTVTVNPLPTPNITGSTTICSGSSSLLDAGAGYNSYLWSNGATTQTISVSLAGTYSVTVTNANGCTGVTSITETVGNALTPTISSVDSVYVCEGNSILFDAGTGFDTYNWSTGETTQTISVSTAADYTVTVTNSTGCLGVSNTATLTINADPVFNPSCSPSTICQGDTSAGNANGNSTWTYSWNPGTISGDTPHLSPNTTTTYTCVATDTNGCSSSNQTTVTVLPLPAIPVITQTGGTLNCSASGATSFQWFLNGGIINGATFSSYNAGQQIGNYTVEISDSNGCHNQSIAFNYLGDAIPGLDITQFAIYPNPFTDNINIQNLNGENEIAILSVTGEVIFRKISTEKQLLINTSFISDGNYLLRIKSKDTCLNKIIVKH